VLIIVYDAIGPATNLTIREKMIVGIAAPFVEGMPCPDVGNQNRKIRNGATAVAMLVAKHSSKNPTGCKRQRIVPLMRITMPSPSSKLYFIE
jgi:hypothetical protein